MGSLARRFRPVISSTPILMFVSGTGTRTFLHELAQQFTSLTKNDLELRFHAGAYFGTRTDATDLLLKRVKRAAAQAELQDMLLWFWTEAARDTGKEKKLGRIVSAGYVEQMGLASLALNLFDRSSSLAAALDLLALRLEHYFGLSNLFLTTFHADFRVNSLDYQWKKLAEEEETQIDRSAIKQQGTGLGLAISNQLVRMMGSSIALESEIGKGSTFSFRIVLELASPEEKQEEKAAISLEHYAGMRILVAEDNELNMEIIRCILEDLGFQVDEAENGKTEGDVTADSWVTENRCNAENKDIKT